MEWKQHQGLLVAEESGIRFTADPRQLGAGVNVIVDGQPCCTSFAGTDSSLSEQTELAYRRGCDLFTVFRGESHFVECYWRVEKCLERVITIESIASVRSTQLQTEQLEFSQAIRAAEGNFIEHPTLAHTFANSIQTCNFAVMVHPQDQAESTILSEPGQIKISIQAPEMERGVIRRFRFLQAFWTGSISLSEYQSVQEWFADSAIPLTT